MSRQKVRVLRDPQGHDDVASGPWVQVSRMANPLVNELIIGTGMKDHWNATDPADEAQFVNFYLNSRLRPRSTCASARPSRRRIEPTS